MHITTLFTGIALAATVLSAPSNPPYPKPRSASRTLIGDPVLLSPVDASTTVISDESHSVPRAVDAVSNPKPTLYQAAALLNHNVHRANHSAVALTWDPTLVSAARTLAHRCVWQHNTSIDGLSYGQNLAAGWARNDIGSAITNGWYGEMPAYKNQYGKATPKLDKFGNYGHFTQLVWKDSRTVGCVTYDCNNAPSKGLVDPDTGKVMDGLNMFTVCNYSPAGNYIGEFGKNVMKSLGHAPFIPKPF